MTDEAITGHLPLVGSENQQKKCACKEGKSKNVLSYLHQISNSSVLSVPDRPPPLPLLPSE